MSKFQIICITCLSCAIFSYGVDLDVDVRGKMGITLLEKGQLETDNEKVDLDVDIQGRMELNILENGQLEIQQNQLFLNDQEIHFEDFLSLFHPSKKPGIPPNPDPKTTNLPETTLPATQSTALTHEPITTEPPDLDPKTTNQLIKTTTTISPYNEIRESSDSESMVVFVIIGSIAVTIAVSGAIVGLLAHFKATPILAAAIAAE